jgi:hypothetical protein
MIYALMFWLAAPVLLAIAIRIARQRQLSWRDWWLWGLIAVGAIVWSLWSQYWAGIAIAICMGAGAFLAEQSKRAEAEAWRTDESDDLEDGAGVLSDLAAHPARLWGIRAVVVIAFIIVVLIAGYLQFNQGLGDCDVISEHRSPAGDFRAVTTDRLCSDFGVASVDPNEWTEIYIIDERRRWLPLQLREEFVNGFSDERFPQIAIRWTTDRSLTIEVIDMQPATSNPVRETTIGDVSVSITRTTP